MRDFAVFVCAVSFAPGCSPSTQGMVNADGGGDPALAGLIALSLSPSSADLVAMNGMPVGQGFIATGTFKDSHTADVSTRVTWSLADDSLGTIDKVGYFTSAAGRAGATQVNAAAGGLTASAALTVTVQMARVSTDDGSTAPPDSAARFAGMDNTPGLAPPIAYPLDGALVPKNLGELEVQWRKPSMPADLFEVSIQGQYLDIKVDTNALQPGGGRQSLQPPEWTAIESAASGSTVNVTVRALLTKTPSQIGGSAPVKLTLGR